MSNDLTCSVQSNKQCPSLIAGTDACIYCTTGHKVRFQHRQHRFRTFSQPSRTILPSNISYHYCSLLSLKLETPDP